MSNWTVRISSVFGNCNGLQRSISYWIVGLPNGKMNSTFIACLLKKTNEAQIICISIKSWKQNWNNPKFEKINGINGVNRVNRVGRVNWKNRINRGNRVVARNLSIFVPVSIQNVHCQHSRIAVYAIIYTVASWKNECEWTHYCIRLPYSRPYREWACRAPELLKASHRLESKEANERMNWIFMKHLHNSRFRKIHWQIFLQNLAKRCRSP